MAAVSIDLNVSADAEVLGSLGGMADGAGYGYPCCQRQGTDASHPGLVSEKL